MEDLGVTLTTIRRRLELASPAPWVLERDAAQGFSYIRVPLLSGDNRILIRREDQPASSEDVHFIVLARNLLPRLVGAIATQDSESISNDELSQVEEIARKATPGPWRPFVEETQPIGGCSVIWIDEGNAPDMYVWLGPRIAPGPDVEFVAHAREDLPLLATQLRTRRQVT